MTAAETTTDIADRYRQILGVSRQDTLRTWPLHADTIAAWLANAAGTYDEVTTTSLAAMNPNTARPTLLDWFNGTSSAAFTVLANPSIADEVTTEFDGLEHTHQARAITNAGLHPDFIDANAHDHVSAVIRNPSIRAGTLCDLIDTLGGNVLAAYANPALPLERIDDALRYGDVATVGQAIHNPNASIETLEWLLRSDRIAAGSVEHATLLVVTETRHAQAEPHSAHVTLLRELPYDAAFAREVVDTDTAASGAVAALMRAGFSGTAAELLSCANSVAGTRDRR